MPTQLPMWVAALNGHFDWPEIYRGYESAVDWPTAGFFRELSAAYPSAKFVLTYRSPESWAQSFSETIYKLLAGKDQAPPEMRPWIEMVIGVVAKTGFPAGLDVPGLLQAFMAHTDGAAIPSAASSCDGKARGPGSR
jgi:hypothetical protein